MDEKSEEKSKAVARRPFAFRFSIRILLFLFVLIAIGISQLIPQQLPLPNDWDFETGRNVKWIAPLGSQTIATPKVHQGRVFIGTNNGHGYDPTLPSKVDLGVMVCFDAENGKFLWQHANRKLEEGRSQDWPLQGVTSQPYTDKDRLWYVSNRCEVVCLDTEGFYDGKNDGVTSEVKTGDKDADVVWKVDMRKRFGVRPHNMSHCNVVVDESRVYVKTSNGVDQAHLDMPAPNAPSFVVLDRVTGETVWTDNTPKHISHGSWGSPTLAYIAGKRQILFPGGDGWLYSFKPAGDGKGNSVLLWKFDCNPKTSRAILGGRGTRNNLLTAPTVHNDRVFITMGQDPEHSEGLSHVWCISPRNLLGDISPTLVKRGPNSQIDGPDFLHCDPINGDVEIPNPSSGMVWRYDGFDSNGDGKIDETDVPMMNRSLSEVKIRNDFAYVNDASGILHCLDAATGKYVWHFDLQSSLWNSPLVTDDRIYVGNEDGEVVMFATETPPDTSLPVKLKAINVPNFSSVYATPVAYKGVLFLVSRNQLIAIEQEPDKK